MRYCFNYFHSALMIFFLDLSKMIEIHAQSENVHHLPGVSREAALRAVKYVVSITYRACSLNDAPKMTVLSLFAWIG